MQKGTGGNAVLAAIAVVGLLGLVAIVIGLIGVCVFIGMRDSGSRTLASGAWTVEPKRSYFTEINFSRNSVLQFEITRTTPGNFGVALLDAANHARVMAIPIDRLVGPNEIDRMFVWEGAGTLSSPNIPLASGRYYIYVENLDERPITVNYKLSETR